MNLETKDYKAKLLYKGRNGEDLPEGTLHAIVSVFGNKDSDDDVIVKGAFKSSIEKAQKLGKFPPGIWHHNWEQPVAKTLDMWEEDDGLHIIGKFNLNTQIGRETHSNIKEEIITEYSFGFRILEFDRKDGIRYIKDLDKKEWSPVLYGSNPLTSTIAIKKETNNLENKETEKIEKKSIFDGVERTLLMRSITTLADKFWRLGYDLAYAGKSKEEKMDELNKEISTFAKLMNQYCSFHLDMIDDVEVDNSEGWLEMSDSQFSEVKDSKTIIYSKKLEIVAKSLGNDLNDDLKSELSRVYSLVRIKNQDSSFLPPWISKSETSEEDSNDETSEDEGSEEPTSDSENISEVVETEEGKSKKEEVFDLRKLNQQVYLEQMEFDLRTGRIAGIAGTGMGRKR